MIAIRPSTWKLALLGHERRQQIPIAMTLAAVAVYILCAITQWLWMRLGYVSPMSTTVLIGINVAGQLLIYAALRSGWSQRFADPSLTMVQMLFALHAIGAAYLFNPHVRGSLLMIGALVLVFGAFTLSPRRCRRLGWLALLIFGSVMLFGALNNPTVFTPIVEGVTFVFAAGTLPLIGHLAGRLSGMRHALREQKAELQLALERMNRLATLDELTGLPNRRYMLDWAGREILRARRSDSPLCIAVLDLDHFKAINDRFGHATGDQALVNFAAEAQTVLRESDTLARWGGEEFLLMLPETPPELAQLVVQRLHEHLHDASSWLRCPEARVTFSAGLASHGGGESFEQILARADLALYEAKRLGRDRWVQAPPAPHAPAQTDDVNAENERGRQDVSA